MFHAMCEAISDEAQLVKLREAVQLTLDDLEEKFAGGKTVDLQGARDLAERCRLLLDRYGDYPAKLQALIIGAVRYFAVGDDPMDDEVFASGLHDDRKIMNHVLEKLGIEDQYLDVS